MTKDKVIIIPSRLIGQSMEGYPDLKKDNLARLGDRIDAFRKQLIADGYDPDAIAKDWAKWDAEHEGESWVSGGGARSRMDFHGVQSIKPGTKVRGYYNGHRISGTVTGHRGNSTNQSIATAEVELDHHLEGDDIVSRKPGDTVSVENNETGHYIEPVS